MRTKKLVAELAASGGWEGNSPAPECEIEELMKAASKPLPSSFLEFLRNFNGGEGGLGSGWEVQRILSAPEVIRAQADWEVDRRIPGAILFGSDMGDFGLLFDTRGGANHGEYLVAACPLSSLSWADAEVVAASFPEIFYRKMEWRQVETPGAAETGQWNAIRPAGGGDKPLPAGLIRFKGSRYGGRMAAMAG